MKRGELMLETSKERVRLLKAGLTGNDIERLYIVRNNIKIIGKPLLFSQIDAYAGETGSSHPGHGAPAKYL